MKHPGVTIIPPEGGFTGNVWPFRAGWLSRAARRQRQSTMNVITDDDHSALKPWTQPSLASASYPPPSHIQASTHRIPNGLRHSETVEDGRGIRRKRDKSIRWESCLIFTYSQINLNRLRGIFPSEAYRRFIALLGERLNP